MNVKIEQTKINALSAKILHRKSKGKLEGLNNFFLILTVIVPILFIVALYVSKGTSYENLINIVSFALSVVLIAVAVLSLIWGVSDKIVVHKLGMKNNIYIANECDNVAQSTEAELTWFFRYVSEMDLQDNDTFSKISDDERQTTYREALKEFDPGNYSIVCPVCKSSPWEFKKGNCQLCGNTKK
ncbi:mobilome CxxCx(11)CxxC protein [Mucilaginibacter sp. SG564]|uniref:mobilome CxxCx(11)CxxC protein n=1 Tax=Mucilaginibacter sp. SG564 TaxID=2587022 RepID=UPI001555BB5C|nr:mobilome CxxCx(11)CxxC protein [Mucilaginibacter sp. SG564]NOW94175.1 mobilome CxxCx(11)CxxC protein [Mucilaginibacter sp. SG564]